MLLSMCRGGRGRPTGPIWPWAGWSPGWRSVVVFLALAIAAHVLGWGDELEREVFAR